MLFAVSHKIIGKDVTRVPTTAQQHEVTLREAVRLTGYTSQHIYYLILNQRIVSRKFNGRHLIDKESLTHYANGQAHAKQS